MEADSSTVASHENEHGSDDAKVLADTQSLLSESRHALKCGQLSLSVPASVAVGEPASAPAGLVRRELVARLRQLIASSSVAEADAWALRARFGLDGHPGGGRYARGVHKMGRQATTNAVNRAIRVLASDLARQPITTGQPPSLSQARREEIIGCALSGICACLGNYATRRYIHARVRHELLDDPMILGAPRTARERQRSTRNARQWIAAAADYLERDEIPWTLYPRIEKAAEQRAIDTDTSGVVPSPDELRSMFATALSNRSPGKSFDPVGASWALIDGYRPMIELVFIADRLVTWQPESNRETEGHLFQRAKMLVVIGNLMALRGYRHLGELYAVRATRIAELGELTADHRSHLQFYVCLVHEALAFVQGPSKFELALAWQERLAADLSRPGVQGDAESLAVAQAIIRAEHCAIDAGGGTGRTLRELLEPLTEPLARGLTTAHPENRARLVIAMECLAKRIGDSDGLKKAEALGSTIADELPPPELPHYDEWYCAWPVVVARWDPSLRQLESSRYLRR